MRFTVPPKDHDERLDLWLSTLLPQHSRSQIQRWIKEGAVALHHETGALRPAQRIEQGQTFVITPPEVRPTHLVEESIPLDIVFEDDALVIVNKAAGMVVHPAAGHRQGTLVHALLTHCGESLRGIGDIQRPGIVHRLDKDTSGLMVVAKTAAAHRHLVGQFQNRSLKRTYHALCVGTPHPSRGTITTLMGRSPLHRQKMAVVTKNGKEAITHYETLKTFGDRALIVCRLDTGRTHQIRVHLQHIGHPLLGDSVYGGRRSQPPLIQRQALHASQLSLIHPVTQQEMHFSCPWPQDFIDAVGDSVPY
ncbi:MAG: RluA family pseudouridine synthase [Alphaproteobacteria bacterium]